MTQIISDVIPFIITPKQLNEAVTGKGGSFIVEGILQRANAKNQNSRVYPKEVLDREIQRYIDNEIKEKRAYGELDHSESQIVNFKNACLHIDDIWWDGDDVMGRVRVLDTPSGKIVKAIMQEGLAIGISSRGTGSTTQIDENLIQVDDDFHLICWDFVTNPSTQNAYMNPKVMNESFDPSLSVDKYQTVNEVVKEILCNNLGFCECDL
jgi:hypothetical protein